MLDVKLNEETQTLEELWDSLGGLCARIAKDNKHYEPGIYPTHLRELQMITIKTLVDCIEQTHEKIDNGVTLIDQEYIPSEVFEDSFKKITGLEIYEFRDIAKEDPETSCDLVWTFNKYRLTMSNAGKYKLETVA